MLSKSQCLKDKGSEIFKIIPWSNKRNISGVNRKLYSRVHAIHTQFPVSYLYTGRETISIALYPSASYYLHRYFICLTFLHRNNFRPIVRGHKYRILFRIVAHRDETSSGGELGRRIVK
jgi:hypothetical protein